MYGLAVMLSIPTLVKLLIRFRMVQVLQMFQILIDAIKNNQNQEAYSHLYSYFEICFLSIAVK
jgi:hypothetical protein